jgi:hypothetical protein
VAKKISPQRHEEVTKATKRSEEGKAASFPAAF